MGNLCGKESSDQDPFAQPGRTLASAPAAARNPTARVPKKVGGPPRTLGSASSNQQQNQQQSSSQQHDARMNAAEAAKARAKAAGKPKGKLSSQLQDQKKQTQSATLDAASRDTRLMRDADAAAETRAYN
ncbi:Uncharacterized protein BP5553_01948 [Venustampulla echinocandica]|uniref:Uncharacterized protein n=1 Tax=Venustampulla echinocandica TaxID=2656787 RepID=A0A370U2G9_9HELO|nr:Uncharacterized protein BP5553_01948 [Venustampulla echinocandica]RDL41969.1 Uncharacterized protein BP5553_01948 [Venustampulla echinocandica]